MIRRVHTDLVLTEIEAQLVADLRNTNKQGRDHIVALARRVAEKFPERQRPELTLVRGSAQ